MATLLERLLLPVDIKLEQAGLRRTELALRKLQGQASTLTTTMRGAGTAIAGVGKSGVTAMRPLGSGLSAATASASEFSKAMEASNARVLAFAASAGAMFQVVNALKFITKAAIDVEKQLMDVNVILGQTTSGLEKFSSSLFGVARNTAQSFKVVTDAATELARQGLSAEETLKRTNDALILTRLSGMDAAASVNALTAAINTFTKEAITSTQIVNKMANVDAAYAVSTTDLAESMRRVGSTAQDVGVNFNQLMAVTAALQQKTARGGSVIGNSLKSIFTRIQRTDVLDQLESMDVAVRNLSGEMKPAMVVLQNLANKFPALSKAQQAHTAELVAGVFQMNNLRALLNDLGQGYSIYSGALKTATDATDEAIRRNEELNKTLSAKLMRTMATLTSVSAKLGDAMFRPMIERVTFWADKSLSGIDDAIGAKAPSWGDKVAKGMVTGIGEVLKGPGLGLIMLLLGKLTAHVGKFATTAAAEFAGVQTRTSQIKVLQENINRLLQAQPGLIAMAAKGAEGRMLVERHILNLMREQGAVQKGMLGMAGSMGLGMFAGGARVGKSGGVTGGTSAALRPAGRSGSTISPSMRELIEKHFPGGPGGSPFMGFAKGHVPNFRRTGKSQETISALAGGYRPGQVKQMNMPGLGSVTYNTREQVKHVPGFAQPFINPPVGSPAGQAHRSKSLQQTGINPYAGGGHVPNFMGRGGIGLMDALSMAKSGGKFFTIEYFAKSYNKIIERNAKGFARKGVVGDKGTGTINQRGSSTPASTHLNYFDTFRDGFRKARMDSISGLRFEGQRWVRDPKDGLFGVDPSWKGGKVHPSNAKGHVPNFATLNLAMQGMPMYGYNIGTSPYPYTSTAGGRGFQPTLGSTPSPSSFLGQPGWGMYSMTGSQVANAFQPRDLGSAMRSILGGDRVNMHFPQEYILNDKHLTKSNMTTDKETLLKAAQKKLPQHYDRIAQVINGQGSGIQQLHFLANQNGFGASPFMKKDFSERYVESLVGKGALKGAGISNLEKMADHHRYDFQMSRGSSPMFGEVGVVNNKQKAASLAYKAMSMNRTELMKILEGMATSPDKMAAFERINSLWGEGSTGLKKGSTGANAMSMMMGRRGAFRAAEGFVPNFAVMPGGGGGFGGAVGKGYGRQMFGGKPSMNQWEAFKKDPNAHRRVLDQTMNELTAGKWLQPTNKYMSSPFATGIHEPQSLSQYYSRTLGSGKANSEKHDRWSSLMNTVVNGSKLGGLVKKAQRTTDSIITAGEHQVARGGNPFSEGGWLRMNFAKSDAGRNFAGGHVPNFKFQPPRGKDPFGKDFRDWSNRGKEGFSINSSRDPFEMELFMKEKLGFQNVLKNRRIIGQAMKKFVSVGQKGGTSTLREMMGEAGKKPGGYGFEKDDIHKILSRLHKMVKRSRTLPSHKKGYRKEHPAWESGGNKYPAGVVTGKDNRKFVHDSMGYLDKGDRNALQRFIDNATKAGFAGGHVPNFASPMGAAVKREIGGGVSPGQVYASFVKTPKYTGPVIANKRDEPTRASLHRAVMSHPNPSMAGATAAGGYVPNFMGMGGDIGSSVMSMGMMMMMANMGGKIAGEGALNPALVEAKKQLATAESERKFMRAESVAADKERGVDRKAENKAGVELRKADSTIKLLEKVTSADPKGSGKGMLTVKQIEKLSKTFPSLKAVLEKEAKMRSLQIIEERKLSQETKKTDYKDSEKKVADTKTAETQKTKEYNDTKKSNKTRRDTITKQVVKNEATLATAKQVISDGAAKTAAAEAKRTTITDAKKLLKEQIKAAKKAVSDPKARVSVKLQTTKGGEIVTDKTATKMTPGGISKAQDKLARIEKAEKDATNKLNAEKTKITNAEAREKTADRKTVSIANERADLNTKQKEKLDARNTATQERKDAKTAHDTKNAAIGKRDVLRGRDALDKKRAEAKRQAAAKVADAKSTARTAASTALRAVDRHDASKGKAEQKKSAHASAMTAKAQAEGRVTEAKAIPKKALIKEYVRTKGFGIGLAGQMAANVMAELFGGKGATPESRKKKAGIKGVGTVMGMAGMGAMIGGPWGAAAGAAVGTGLAIHEYIEAGKTTAEDYANALKDTLKPQQESIQAMQKYGQTLAKLNDAYGRGADPKEIAILNNNLAELFADITDPTVRAEIIASAGDINKLSTAMAQLAEEAKKAMVGGRTVVDMAGMREKESYTSAGVRNLGKNISRGFDLKNEADFSGAFSGEFGGLSGGLQRLGVSKEVASDMADEVGQGFNQATLAAAMRQAFAQEKLTKQQLAMAKSVSKLQGVYIRQNLSLLKLTSSHERYIQVLDAQFKGSMGISKSVSGKLGGDDRSVFANMGEMLENTTFQNVEQLAFTNAKTTQEFGREIIRALTTTKEGAASGAIEDLRAEGKGIMTTGRFDAKRFAALISRPDLAVGMRNKLHSAFEKFSGNMEKNTIEVAEQNRLLVIQDAMRRMELSQTSRRALQTKGDFFTPDAFNSALANMFESFAGGTGRVSRARSGQSSVKGLKALEGMGFNFDLTEYGKFMKNKVMGDAFKAQAGLGLRSLGMSSENVRQIERSDFDQDIAGDIIGAMKSTQGHLMAQIVDAANLEKLAQEERQYKQDLLKAESEARNAMVDALGGNVDATYALVDNMIQLRQSNDNLAISHTQASTNFKLALETHIVAMRNLGLEKDKQTAIIDTNKAVAQQKRTASQAQSTGRNMVIHPWKGNQPWSAGPQHSADRGVVGQTQSEINEATVGLLPGGAKFGGSMVSTSLPASILSAGTNVVQEGPAIDFNLIQRNLSLLEMLSETTGGGGAADWLNQLTAGLAKEAGGPFPSKHLKAVQYLPLGQKAESSAFGGTDSLFSARSTSDFATMANNRGEYTAAFQSQMRGSGFGGGGLNRSPDAAMAATMALYMFNKVGVSMKDLNIDTLDLSKGYDQLSDSQKEIFTNTIKMADSGDKWNHEANDVGENFIQMLKSTQQWGSFTGEGRTLFEFVKDIVAKMPKGSLAQGTGGAWSGGPGVIGAKRTFDWDQVDGKLKEKLREQAAKSNAAAMRGMGEVKDYWQGVSGRQGGLSAEQRKEMEAEIKTLEGLAQESEEAAKFLRADLRPSLVDLSAAIKKLKKDLLGASVYGQATSTGGLQTRSGAATAADNAEAEIARKRERKEANEKWKEEREAAAARGQEARGRFRQTALPTGFGPRGLAGQIGGFSRRGGKNTLREATQAAFNMFGGDESAAASTGKRDAAKEKVEALERGKKFWWLLEDAGQDGESVRIAQNELLLAHIELADAEYELAQTTRNLIEEGSLALDTRKALNVSMAFESATAGMGKFQGAIMGGDPGLKLQEAAARRAVSLHMNQRAKLKDTKDAIPGLLEQRDLTKGASLKMDVASITAEERMNIAYAKAVDPKTAEVYQSAVEAHHAAAVAAAKMKEEALNASEEYQANVVAMADLTNAVANNTENFEAALAKLKELQFPLKMEALTVQLSKLHLELSFWSDPVKAFAIATNLAEQEMVQAAINLAQINEKFKPEVFEKLANAAEKNAEAMVRQAQLNEKLGTGSPFDTAAAKKQQNLMRMRTGQMGLMATYGADMQADMEAQTKGWKETMLRAMHDIREGMKSDIKEGFGQFAIEGANAEEVLKNIGRAFAKRLFDISFDMTIGRMMDQIFSGTVGHAPGLGAGARNNQAGGLVQNYASGGMVRGEKGIDKNFGMLSEGEFVMRKSAVDNLGEDFMNRLNGAQKMATGGAVKYDPDMVRFSGRTAEEEEDVYSQAYLHGMNIKGIANQEKVWYSGGQMPGQTLKDIEQEGNDSLGFNLKNSFLMNDPDKPSLGQFLVSNRLSNYAMDDPNNPQNEFRNKRRNLFGDYVTYVKNEIESRQEQMDQFEEAKKNVLKAGYIQAGVSMASAGLEFAAESLGPDSAFTKFIQSPQGQAVVGATFAAGTTAAMGGTGEQVIGAAVMGGLSGGLGGITSRFAKAREAEASIKNMNPAQLAALGKSGQINGVDLSEDQMKNIGERGKYLTWKNQDRQYAVQMQRLHNKKDSVAGDIPAYHALDAKRTAAMNKRLADYPKHVGEEGRPISDNAWNTGKKGGIHFSYEQGGQLFTNSWKQMRGRLNALDDLSRQVIKHQRLGGLIKGYNSGGEVDSVPAMLTDGEFVINKGAVGKLGVPYLNRLNRGQGMQAGGVVGQSTGQGGPVSPAIPGNEEMSDAMKELLDVVSTIKDVITVSAEEEKAKKAGDKAVGNRGAEGGAENITNNVTVTVNVTGGGAETQTKASTNNNKKSDEEGSSAKDLERNEKFAGMLKGVVLQTITEQQRPGGLLAGTR